MRGDGDGACEQFHEVQEEGDMETSGDWEMARVRWVFGERGRETGQQSEYRKSGGGGQQSEDRKSGGGGQQSEDRKCGGGREQSENRKSLSSGR